MSNEEFQRLVLEKLGGIETCLDKIETRLDRVEERLSNLELRLDKVEERLGSLEARMDKVETRLDGLDLQMGKVETRLDNLEAQMSETNGIVKALMHRTEELDAKFDGLLLQTASKEAVERIEETVNRIAAIQATQGESINILALRQLQTESEVAALKKAK